MEEYERIAKRQYDKMNERSPVPKGFESQAYEKLKERAYQTYVAPFEGLVSIKENVNPETLQTLLDAKKEDTRIRVATGNQRGMSESAIRGLGETSEYKTAKTNAKLEGMGIDINRGAPIENWKVGLAETPEKGLQKILSDYYKVQVPVKKIDGEYVYKDPSDGRLVRADIGTAASVISASPDIADVAATIALPEKALLTNPIKKEAGTSGVVSGITELARLSIGNLVNANDLDTGEIISLAAKKGGINSLLTGVGGFAYKTINGIKNFFTGGVFTREEAARQGIASVYADAVIDESDRISKLVSDGKKVRPTSYQKTAAVDVNDTNPLAGDVNLGAVEADIRNRPEFSQEFADRDVSNKKVLSQTIKGLHKPETLPLIDKGDITDIAARKMSERTGRMESVVTPNVNKNLKDIRANQGVPYEGVGDTTKEFITKADEAAKGKEIAQWQKVEDIGGYDPKTRKYEIDIPEGKLTKKLRKEYAQQSKESITKIGSRAPDTFSKATSTPIIQPKTKIQEIMARVNKSLGEKKLKKGDLAYVNAEISALKAEYRNKALSATVTPSQRKYIKDTYQAIEADRNLYLTKTGRGDLIEQIQKAENETRKYHEVFSRSKIGDLLSVNKNGVPKIKTDEYVDNILKGDVIEAQQLKSVIDNDPAMGLTFRQGIANKYTREVYSDGRFSREKSDKFFSNPVISEFFTKAEIKGFKRRGDFAEKVEKQVKQLKQFKKTAGAKYGIAQLAKTDSRSLVSNILGDSKMFTIGGKERKDAVGKVKYIKNMFANHPQSLSQFKNEYNRRMSESLIDSDGVVISGALDKLVSNSKLMEIAAEINGKQYVKNLTTMNNMNKILNKKAVNLNSDERGKMIEQALRGAYFAPLSRRGRVFSAYLTWDSNATKRVMKRALLDDSVMAKIAELSKSKKWTREFFEKSASLGLYGDTSGAFSKAQEYADLTGEELR